MATQAALGSDPQRRIGLTTQTPYGHCDQVIGISQCLINKGFEDLYNLHPEMGKYYKSETGIGMINAELLAPQVFIPSGALGDNNRIIHFRVRFNSGSIQGTQGDIIVEDLSNWVFTFVCDFDRDAPFMKQDGDERKTNEQLATEKELRQKETDWLWEQYSRVGDYSVERLYTELASANWGRPDYKLSQAGLTEAKEPRSLEAWMAKYSDPAKLLSFFLNDWGTRQMSNGKNYIGVSFKLREESRDAPLKYKPSSIRHGVSVYKTPTYPKGAQGVVGPRDRNSILLYEMVESESHRFFSCFQPGFAGGGNFVTVPSTENGNKQIDGTYILSYTVFWDRFILPELRALNLLTDFTKRAIEANFQGRVGRVTTPSKNKAFDEATGIIQGSPACYIDAHGNSITLDAPLKFGPIYDNQFDIHFQSRGHQFDPVYVSGDTGQVKFYRWTSNINTTHTQKVDMGAYWCYCQASTEGASSTTVTWSPGTPFITIKGATNITQKADWNLTLQQMHGFLDPQQGDKIPGKLENQYTVDWGFKIRIVKNIDNFEKQEYGYGAYGALSCSIDERDFYLKVTYLPIRKSIDLSNSGEIESALREGFSTLIRKVCKTIESNLSGDTARVFAFPGNSTLLFSNPILSEWGDLITDITYRPLDPGGMHPLPGEADSLDPEGLEPGDPTENSGRKYPPGFRLKWSLTPSKVKKNTKTTISFRADNQTGDTLFFKQLAIKFTSGTRRMDLFTAKIFTAEPPPKKPSTAGGATAPVKAQATEEPGPGRRKKIIKDEDEYDDEYERPYTSATIGHSPEFPECTLQIKEVGADDTSSYWQATISNDKVGQLVVPTGSWIEVSITGATSAPRSYSYNIIEDWNDASGKSVDRYDESRDISVFTD